MNKLFKYISYGFAVFIAWYIVFGVDSDERQAQLQVRDAFLSCKLPKDAELKHFAGRGWIVVFQSPYFSFPEYEQNLIDAGWMKSYTKNDEISYSREQCIYNIKLLDEGKGIWQELITQKKL